MKKHPYYIYTPRYTRTSAGVKCLHLLCDHLNRLGFDAYVYFFGKKRGDDFSPDLNTPLLTKEIRDQHFAEQRQPVIIYPETVTGNPFRADCVVRYLLNYPGLLGGERHLNKNEIIIAYAAPFAEGCDFLSGILETPTINQKIFYTVENQERRGTCYYAMKYQYAHGAKVFGIPEGSIEITRDLPQSQSPEEIADIFRRSEILYCFENTALGTEAILCGCPTVLMPSPHLRKPEGLSDEEWYGLAWGTDPQEIERAKSTVHLAEKNYSQKISKFYEDLDRFISISQKYAKNKSYTHPVRLPPFPFSYVGGRDFIRLSKLKAARVIEKLFHKL